MRRRCPRSGKRRGARWPTCPPRGRSSSTRRRSITAMAPGAALFVDLLRHPREGTLEVVNLKPAYETLLKQFDPKVLEHDMDPPPPRGPAVEEIGREAAGIWRDIRVQVSFIGETTSALVLRRAASELGALEGRLAHLRTRRRRRAADRRADLVPARHDPRVPVGGADEALRRRDLRRRSDRPVDAARAGAADDGDPARRPLRRRVRRRDRHDARQPGGRRADDDGARPGPLPGDAAHHRRGADDAAAHDIFRPRRPRRRRGHDADVRDSVLDVPQGSRQRGHA